MAAEAANQAKAANGPQALCCACCAVMLTTQWTTLVIALTQRLLLGHRLPLAFWPCATAMLAGAAMVIVPSIGQSTAGSLKTARGWWGFAMAVGALICTVIYYCLLQVRRPAVLLPLPTPSCLLSCPARSR